MGSAILKIKTKTICRSKFEGTHSHHWQHKNKWSFKIKVRDDEKSIFD